MVCTTPQCTSHRCVPHSAESSNEKFSKNSAMCIIPRSQTLQCPSSRGVRIRGVASDCGIRLHGGHQTAESESIFFLVSGWLWRDMQIKFFNWGAQISLGEKLRRLNLNVHSAPSCTRLRQNFWNLLSNIWSKSNYLSLFIRIPGGIESWKKQKSKILWHTPIE